MKNIDALIETQDIVISVVDNNNIVQQQSTNQSILNGYDVYRKARMNGDIVFDTRIAYNINEKSKFSLLVNNLLNREYTNRPGNVLPPRTILWQYSLKF
jgi:outer membrane receptor protein involved in Fe transport